MDQRDPESLFSAWAEEAERVGFDAAPAFEALLAAHPNHADVLRRMHGDWLHFAPLLARVVPGLMASQMGLGDGPLPSGGDDAPQPVTPELLERLGIQVPDSGRYRFRGVLGQGGGGVVLRVWDQKLQRSLAMKVVLGASELRAGQPRAGQDTPPVDAAVLTRFVDEARIASQLDHPSIVPVHELGTDATGRAYFTMRLVRGQDLHRILQARRNGDTEWSETRLLGLLAKACEAVGYAHERGVVHRDLKPSNIMVGRHGEVHVMDWGLARVLVRDAAARAASAASTPSPTQPQRSEVRSIRRSEREATPGSPLLTGAGTALGTPAYMAPEQARGEHDRVDARADVYALGAVLYEILGGTPPFVPAGAIVDAGLIYLRLLEGPPRPIRELAPRAPEQLIAITERAMARDASERYPDVRALEADLRAFLERRVVRAYRTGAWAETGQWVRRNPWLATSLGALLSVVLGFTLILAERGRELRRRGDEALAARGDERRANEELRWEFYCSALFEAGSALDRGELRNARDWLSKAPEPCRGWEWGHLDRVLNGESLRIKSPATSFVQAVYSPDGRTIATIGEDDVIRAYDSSDGRCVMQSHALIESAVGGGVMQFSLDGQRLIVSCGGFYTYAWDHVVIDAATGSVQSILKSDDYRRSSGTVYYDSYQRSSDSFIRRDIGAEHALEVLDGKGATVARFPSQDFIAEPYIAALGRSRRYLAYFEGNRCRVWDLRSMTLVGTIDRLESDPRNGEIEICANERFLLHDCGEVRVYDLTSFANPTIVEWNVEHWSPWNVSFTPDGSRIVALGPFTPNVSGSKDHMGVATWSLTSKLPAEVFYIGEFTYAHLDLLHSLDSSNAFVSTGSSLLCLDANDGFQPSEVIDWLPLLNDSESVDVTFIDATESLALDDLSRVWTLQGQPKSFPLGGVRPLDEGYKSIMNPNGRQVCALSDDGALHVWDLNELVSPLQYALASAGSDATRICYVGSTGSSIAVVLDAESQSPGVGIFNCVTGQLERRVGSAEVTAVHSNRDCTRLLTFGTNIGLWDTGTWQCLATIPSEVAPSMLGSDCFVVERGGDLAVHRFTDGSLMHETTLQFDSPGSEDEVATVGAVLHGDIAVLLAESGAYRLVDLLTLKQVTPPPSSSTVHWYLARPLTAHKNLLSLDTGDAIFWDKNGSSHLVHDIGWYSPVHVTHDGRRVLGTRSATNDRAIVLIDLETSAVVATFPGATSDVVALTMYPDESRVVAVTDDGVLYVWDAHSSRRLLRVRVSAGADRGATVQFSPDGHTLLLTGVDEDSPLLMVSSIAPRQGVVTRSR